MPRTFAVAAIVATSAAIRVHHQVHPLNQTPVEFNTFAQLNDHCSFAHDRVKNGPADFNAKQQATLEYEDETFSGLTMIRDPAHSQDRGYGDLSAFYDAADIVDINTQYPDSQGYSLFGTRGIDAQDIYQGNLGNCWFMHGAAAVANKASRLEKVFLNTELSDNGIYGFEFYILGVPTTVTIDDNIPHSVTNNVSAFAKVSDDKALWGILIEKAFAKLHGNYESLQIGFPTHSIDVLTGAPATKTVHHPADNISQTDMDVLFEAVKAALLEDGMISGATGPSQSDNINLVGDHIYTILEAIDFQGHKLYKIRNPWGYELYTGNGGDSDPYNWDTTLQDAVGHDNANDGVFLIDQATYHAEFKYTVIHHDTTNMNHSFFLVTDDETVADSTGYSNTQFTVTNSGTDTQDVYLTSHTWPSRTYPDDCLVDFKDDSGHQIHGIGAAQWWKDSYGSPAITMTAGQEITVTLRMHWVEKQTKDFSLVAWSTGSTPVNIYSANNGGISETWPCSPSCPDTSGNNVNPDNLTPADPVTTPADPVTTPTETTQDTTTVTDEPEQPPANTGPRTTQQWDAFLAQEFEEHSLTTSGCSGDYKVETIGSEGVFTGFKFNCEMLETYAGGAYKNWYYWVSYKATEDQWNEVEHHCGNIEINRQTDGSITKMFAVGLSDGGSLSTAFFVPQSVLINGANPIKVVNSGLAQEDFSLPEGQSNSCGTVEPADAAVEEVIEGTPDVPVGITENPGTVETPLVAWINSLDASTASSCDPTLHVGEDIYAAAYVLPPGCPTKQRTFVTIGPWIDDETLMYPEPTNENGVSYGTWSGTYDTITFTLTDEAGKDRFGVQWGGDTYGQDASVWFTSYAV